MIKLLTVLALVDVTIAGLIPDVLPGAGFPEGRIIGGENTTVEKVPYQVGISVTGRHYCGGSIINKDWVLTAAHCATRSAQDYAVLAGSSSSRVGGSTHKVWAIISHEHYFIDELRVPSNDIALFRLSTPIKMDKTRQPIKLFQTDEKAQPGECSVITGWGTIFPNEQVPPVFLQIVSIPIISKADCRKAYRNFTNVNHGQICAAHPNGGKDACQGDSGGPHVIDRRLAGIVSWGNGCAVRGNPGVYTEVAYFNQWITEAMRAWKNSSSVLTSTLSLGTLMIVTIGCMVFTT